MLHILVNATYIGKCNRKITFNNRKSSLPVLYIATTLLNVIRKQKPN